MGWNQIRWTEARQIASLMGADDAALPAAGLSPEDHYRALRATEDRTGAALFLGAALPRLEAVAWAGRVLEQEAAAAPLRPADRQALDHSLRWLGDQSDQSRRAARAAGETAGESSAERLLAMSVFFSGGSISEPDLPPIPPAPGITGRCAATAIIVAAGRSAATRNAVMDRALDLGERIAADGTRALEVA